MKRMVNQDIIDFIQGLYDSKALGFDEGSNTLQVGSNLEVDAYTVFNSTVKFDSEVRIFDQIKFNTSNNGLRNVIMSISPEEYGGDTGIVDGVFNSSWSKFRGIGFSMVNNAKSSYLESTIYWGIYAKDVFNSAEYFGTIFEISSEPGDFDKIYFRMYKPTSFNNGFQSESVLSNITYQYTDNLTAIANQAFRTIDMTKLKDDAICINAVEVENTEGEVIDGVITSMPKWNGTNWQITLYNLSGASIANFKVNVTYFRILDTD